MRDWEDHMSVAFTDVRLKGYIEMRGADGGPWDRICALPAVWVGLLYDEDALEETEKIAKQISYEEVIEATFDCSKTGLNSKIGKFKSQELAIELLKIAKTGLKKRNFLNSSGENETGYLSPLLNMAEEGKTLADTMLQKYLKDWNKDPKKAIENQII